MNRKNLKHLIYALIFLIAGGAAYYWLQRPTAIKVRTATAAPGLVQKTVANTRAGTVKACKRSALSPSIGGQIIRLNVKEGQRVKKGQLLMEFWNDDLNAKLELAQKQLRATEARSREACVMAATAMREANRLLELRRKKLASDEITDKASGEASAREAACKASRTQIEVSHAQVAVAQTALQRTRLLAPFAGIAAQVNGELGEFITPSPIGIPTPPAIDLIDSSCLYVSAPMDEVDAPNIKKDMPARISLDAFGDTIFKGKVQRIAPYVQDREKQARTVEVEARFDDPEITAKMLPGYSADLEIILAEKADALRIPSEAILEGNKVLVVTEDNRLEQIRIKTGLSNWQFTEVTAGLKAGQIIVVSVDQEGVKAGALVTTTAAGE